MTDTRYVDSQGVHGIYPASASKRYREMKRAVDPFPPGKMIGGKRYWLVEQVLDWLARQDDPPLTVAVSRKAAPENLANPAADAAPLPSTNRVALREAEPRQAEPAEA